MTDQEKWTCFAKPAALGGKTCGHENTGARQTRVMGRVVGYCDGCGCTRKASNDRRDAQ
jgi:hypothetical protein